MPEQYEVEHNIKESPDERPKRRVDMSSFNSHLNNVVSTASVPGSQHNNPHAVPTAVDMSALYRLLQDQYHTLLIDTNDPENREFLTRLIDQLDSDIQHPPYEVRGVSQDYIDSLERIPIKRIKEDDTCPICTSRLLADEHPLVVRLPCHKSHIFDLECVAPWLLAQGTCPTCRANLVKKKEKEKEVVAPDEDEEDYEAGGMFA